MKKFLRIIALVMTVALFVLTLSSCNSIKLSKMTEDEKAIYFYDRMCEKLEDAQSYIINSNMKVEQKFGEITDDSELRIEASLSDKDGDGLKYVEKEYEIEDGKPELQGEFGFDDGKIFLSLEENKMVSEVNAEDFRVFMDETTKIEDADFNITTDNCAKTSYNKTENKGYKVAFSNFSGDAVSALVARMSNLLGLNRGILTVKSYSLDAEMDKKYIPLNETEIIELEVNFGYEGSMSLKLTVNTEYSNVNEDVTPEIPDLGAFKAISDVRAVMLANMNVKSFTTSDSGSFNYHMKISAKNAIATAAATTKYDIEYGNKDSGFEYTLDGSISASTGEKQTVKMEYKNENLKKNITVNGKSTQSNDNISADIVKYEFATVYLNVLQFDMTKVKSVESTTSETGDKSVKVIADVNDEALRKMYQFNSENILTTEEFTYVFVYNGEGDIISIELTGTTTDSGIEYSLYSKVTFK